MNLVNARGEPGGQLALSSVGLRPIAAASGAAVAAVFLAAVALPLATYTTALATFGLAHVGSELRYVDHRFGRRLCGGVVGAILAPLAAALAVRVCAIAGLLAGDTAIACELALGGLMGAAAVLAMPRHRLVGAGAVVALVSGAVLAPIQTLLVLAVAHNFAPVAFLADALAGVSRRRVLAAASVPFLLLPLLIATGLPYGVMSAAGLVDPEASLFDGGPLFVNMDLYVPASLLDTPWALPMFSATVFAQCMHYAVVILVLPWLIGADARAPRTLARWPEAPRFAAILAAAALALAVGFAIDFRMTRQIYAVAALAHSWLEIPIVLLFIARAGRGPLNEVEGVKRETEAG